MKNIHVLPTEKPSRLFKFANELHLDTIPKDYYKKYNIYITSDEEIKEGDWCYDEYNKVVFKNTCAGTPGASKKIILTTDQDLIADGVQSIDDEFLEWFVKNPSCEYVGIKSKKIRVDKNFNDISHWNRLKYEILIPKEEPKQETLEEATEKYSEFQAGTFTPPHKTTYEHGFEDGAKWQSDRMYSEEEVLIILDKFLTSMIKGEKTGLLNQWFEQFKKK
jgi:hypothetical protein